ncbi:hypothetical protein D3C81_1077780 [compost metagenome]
MLEVALDDRVGEVHCQEDVVDPLSAHVTVGLACAIADASGETVPAVVGALQAFVDALVQLTEFLIEVSFDIAPTGDVG